MSKKSRRAKKSGRPRLSATQMAQPGAGLKPAAKELTAAIQGRAKEVREVNLQEEYRHTIADLKRISFIAAIVLAIYIGLAFVLK